MDSCLTCTGCSPESRKEYFNNIKEKYQDTDLTTFEYDFETYSRPYSMILGLTDDCNLQCSYCFVKQNTNYMTFEVADQAIQWLKQNYIATNREGKPSVTFFGGEPLLCFDSVIVPIVEKYRDEIDFSITTNGILLDEDKVDFFYKNNIEILLSFDGVRSVQNTQRSSKNLDSYETVLKNIPYLLLRRPNTIMRMTLTKYAVPHLFETVLMAEELGFKSISFCVDAFEDWEYEDLYNYEEQLEKIGLHIYKSFFNKSDEAIKVDQLIKTYNKIEQSLQGNLKYNNSLFRCGLGTTSCAITPTGDIVPCQEKISNPTWILGDVFNGIDANKHKEFLKWYIDNMNNNFTCDRLCRTNKEAVHCFSNTCPSRLEDLNFKSSTSECIFNRTNLRIANRLFMLCYKNINPLMENYFQGGNN